MFKRYQSTCLSSVTFWDCIPTFWLSDADAIKAISTDRAVYLKDVEAVGDFARYFVIGVDP